MAGALAGGRLGRLATLRLRWAALAVGALLVQLVQFSGPGASLLGDAGPLVYAGTTALVLAVILRNWRLTGMPIVAAGAASNLAAIVANGGWMPSDPAALAAAGISPGTGPSNGIVLDSPALQPLTDIFAIPAGLPFANVFSVGDVLIGLGVVVVIAVAMRRGPGQGTGRGPAAMASGEAPRA